MKAQYEQVTETAADGTAVFRRLSDGYTASVKAAYFKPSPRGGGLIPGSGAKRIRLAHFVDWTPPGAGAGAGA